MSTTEATTNGNIQHSDNHSIGGSDFDYAALANISNEDFGDFDSSALGSALFQPSNLDYSESFSGTSGSDFEFTDAENAIIRFARGTTSRTRGRNTGTKKEKAYITHEDFDEGIERDAFLLIYGYSENLFDTIDKKPFDPDDLKKKRAIEFFFCNTIGGIHLEEALTCIDSQIRVDVLRLRFQLEFWMREWTLPAMPATAVPMPTRIELMAAQHEGSHGIALAREAWFQPGLKASELIERICDGESEKAIEAVKRAFIGLADNYIISLTADKVYTTGKNPIQELEDQANDPTMRNRGRLANLYWSRKF